LAKLFGAVIYTTVGSQEKVKIAEDLGANIAINYKTEDFVEILKDKGVDVILDSIGGDYFGKNIDILNEDGRLVYINAMQGPKVELNIMKIMQKRIVLTGSTLRGREKEFKSRLTKEIETNILPLVENGKFKPVMSKIFPFESVSDAHIYFESPDQYGKIVLKMDS
jgi:NADPH:quinone reductase-like Zn-dependent oxidoreductase